MNTKNVFNSLPAEIKDILIKNGIRDLYPPQAEAVEENVLGDGNFILSMPTASGKTLIAEMVMLKIIMEKKGNCLYTVPLRALASEKFDDFKAKYSSLGVKVGIATGDYDYVDPYLTKNDILIATAEKADSLLRQKPEWLCLRLACAVIDEIHYIGDPKRGPTLETVITRLRNIKPGIKLLGLSATIANAHALAGWLSAGLISSEWRPVPLREGVYFDGKITFSDGRSKHLDLRRICDETAALAVDCVKEKGQALVFVNTRKSAQAEAARIAKEMHSSLSSRERALLEQLSENIAKSDAETTKVVRQLSECVKNGVVFHHAGLNFAQRRLIEDNFCRNVIKVICATPTLAVGVNLPSRRTIIRSLYRYASGEGMKPVSVLEYKQMSGRAGRPKYDKFGEAVLFAKSQREQDELFDTFIFAAPEPVHSYMGSENALRVHLLSSVVINIITSMNTAFEFINKTFFAYERRNYDIHDRVEQIIGFLLREEMIRRRGEKLLPTAFGTRISRLYLDPLSAVLIRDCLRESGGASWHPLTVLFLVCCLPDMSILALNRSDIEKIVPFIDTHKGVFELPLPFNDDYQNYLAKVKTVRMLSRWMNEEREDLICEQFNIGPGDIHRFVELTDWLLYSAAELFRLLSRNSPKPLHDLRTQIKYGIKAELLELVNLKGIGRIRARSLYNHGITNLRELAETSVETLQQVPHIGRDIALSIKQQTAAHCFSG